MWPGFLQCIQAVTYIIFLFVDTNQTKKLTLLSIVWTSGKGACYQSATSNQHSGAFVQVDPVISGSRRGDCQPKFATHPSLALSCRSPLELVISLLESGGERNVFDAATEAQRCKREIRRNLSRQRVPETIAVPHNELSECRL
jgi:hypothetical protein